MKNRPTFLRLGKFPTDECELDGVRAKSHALEHVFDRVAERSDRLADQCESMLVTAGIPHTARGGGK